MSQRRRPRSMSQRCNPHPHPVLTVPMVASMELNGTEHASASMGGLDHAVTGSVITVFYDWMFYLGVKRKVLVEAIVVG